MGTSSAALPRWCRWLRRILIGLAVALVLIQAVPYGHNHANPPVVKEPAWDAPATRALAVRACFDCHSNESRWPWYSHVAPVSWFVVEHVEDGRKHLNFSEFQRTQKHAREASEEVEDGEMPLTEYVWLHPEARLSEAERAELLKGLRATFGASEKKGKRSKGD